MHLMKANVFTAPDLLEAAFKNMDENKHLNCFVTYADRKQMMKEAEQAQIRIDKSKHSYTLIRKQNKPCCRLIAINYRWNSNCYKR